MAVQGKQKEQKEFVKELFVGFTTVKVIAVNPTREELNKLLNKDDSEDDKEIVYMGSDAEGNNRLRLTFWLKSIETGKLFVYSFNLTDKERKSKNGDKVQLVNQTCTTTWAPYIMKGEDITDKIDESLIPEWFSNFTTKEKEVIGPKSFRKALAGEEELAVLLRSWLGRLDFTDTSTEVLVDTKKLFKENYKELRELISLDEDGEFDKDGLDTPFVALFGVRTDDDDSKKKYQQVWGKSFLPAGFMKYINNGNKFPTDYTRKVWERFSKEVTADEYGFNGYTELCPLKAYNEADDVSGGEEVAVEDPTTSGY